ncbi:MAG: molybdopterin molybdotransferase MoeA [Alphaproteobacteria bacterium]|nr:molybdopterin molybdotransferase MoeA [Alphaproteobacteria bacterium]MBU0799048.1 molybdopterin molybdotransferase MoeA [Alphaproteobacteria bacterium]MBU0886249.1 molybdopterin molybdotransferase MoeA [Alphaproteobacteria bacterium]MBU1815094.1 molybdopterin molybdotransferase MoeA [Alphaproteobacteria bacterium]MBU2090252.1 molybdopterin molybdotransferase MoeA [Alphaproteobacteria bacterium]
MIPVEDALQRILAGLTPLDAEDVSLDAALGRVLAQDVAARVTQPPKPVSAMDGYAVKAADVASVPAVLTVIGSAPAGRGFQGVLESGQAVRIFTGAPLPDGADSIVIQEDTEASGDQVTVKEAPAPGNYVRAAGLDFRQGDIGLTAGKQLTARDIGLAAAMNHPWLRVVRRPRIAILATGDEIVRPGDPIGRDQIVSSNALALAAFVRGAGGEPVVLGIAPDDMAGLKRMLAGARGTDLLVTTGGASVGDHDLIQTVLGETGTLDFWKIAMRPGKPLMFGTVSDTPVLGLPGNPVSSMVCALLFLGPAMAKLLGREAAAPATRPARLGSNLKANDRRQDYLRASLEAGTDGLPLATPFGKQDSSQFSLLAQAQCLIVRPPHDTARSAGDTVQVIPFEDRYF